MAACDWAEERLVLSAVGMWAGLEAQEGNRRIGNGEAEGRCAGEWTHHSAGLRRAQVMAWAVRTSEASG